MAEAAAGLLAGLREKERATARIPFDNTELRHRFSYLPRLHSGLSLSGMPQISRKAVMRLLATALSPIGYAKAVAVMGLEELLDRQEEWRKGRHVLDYWVAVFGEPGAAPWGWRFEGHHLSVTMTITDQGIATTPLFLGAHPARVDGPAGPVLAPLGDEDALGLALLASLPADLVDKARVSVQAPVDIHSGASPHFTETIKPRGVAAEEMPGEARILLGRLVDCYDSILNPDVLAAQPERQAGTSGLHFAWEGPIDGSGPRYYRVQGKRLLIEYSLTTGLAGHVHSVRRVPGLDFGA
jgi:hypothetical protein